MTVARGQSKVDVFSPDETMVCEFKVDDRHQSPLKNLQVEFSRRDRHYGHGDVSLECRL